MLFFAAFRAVTTNHVLAQCGSGERSSVPNEARAADGAGLEGRSVKSTSDTRTHRNCNKAEPMKGSVQYEVRSSLHIWKL